MNQVKISGPVAAVILVIVLLIVLAVGYRAVNPPQELGPTAKALRDGMLGPNAGQR
jgi:hypothetical protein